MEQRLEDGSATAGGERMKIKRGEIPVITIRQPWAWCITHLDKRTENRSWSPPNALVGRRLAIHSSVSMDSMLSRQAASRISRVRLMERLPEMEMGCIVATATLAGFVQVVAPGRFNVAYAPKNYYPLEDRWLVGPFGWLLEDVELVAPVKVRGVLGIWGFAGALEPLGVR